MPDIECPDSKGIKTGYFLQFQTGLLILNALIQKGLRLGVAIKVQVPHLILNALIQKGLRRAERFILFGGI